MSKQIILPNEYAPRNYQMPAWNYFEQGGKRGVCVWHRRAGKDLFAINLCATKAFERVGLYWHLLPTYNQGRKIVWDGMTKTGRKFLDAFPEELIASKNSTDMRLNLKNGSVYQVVGTDDCDRLVGTNPVGCVFSEYSIQDPRAWNYIRPILMENGGWALFIYTSRGHNHGYELLQVAKQNPEEWFHSVLVAGDKGTTDENGQPVVSDDIIEAERRAGMPDEVLQQEFFCSFDAPIVGAYYGSQMVAASEEDRICTVPYSPELPVNTAWDLGMNDETSIVFWQDYRFERRIIDFYSASGEGLEHYANELNKKGYSYGQHWAPHDIKVRELGTGRSRLEIAKSLGINFRVLPKQKVHERIAAARSILPTCFFDDIKTVKLRECLLNYRKEYDEANKCYRDTPLHDWSSHGADAFGYMAQACNKTANALKRKKRERSQNGAKDYNPFEY